MTEWSFYRSSELGVQRVFLRRRDIVAVKETGDGHSVLILPNGVELGITANAISVMATISDPPDPPTIIIQNPTGPSPVFRGGAEAFATVNVRDGATIIASVTADATGAWEIGGWPFGVGAHLISATQTNLFGQVSQPSDPASIVIDPPPMPEPVVEPAPEQPPSSPEPVSPPVETAPVAVVPETPVVPPEQPAPDSTVEPAPPPVQAL